MTLPATFACWCPRRELPWPTVRWTRAQLERVVLDFWDGEYDVLVCTTIIESGIDMPTVNTLVVDRADLLGLGQLHQLRGRVGRAGQRAYAYLVLSAGARAHRRGLRAVEDHWGIDRTRQWIQDRDARSRDTRRRQPVGADPVGSHRCGRLRPVLPDGERGHSRAQRCRARGAARDRARSSGRRKHPCRLHRREDLRLEAYRRLAAVTSTSEVDDIRSEWEDRYGPVPRGPKHFSSSVACARCVSPPESARSLSQRGQASVAPRGSSRSAQCNCRRAKWCDSSVCTRVRPIARSPRCCSWRSPKKTDVAGQLLAALLDLLPAVSPRR